MPQEIEVFFMDLIFSLKQTVDFGINSVDDIS
jgi:hypothetical protein